MTAKGRKTTCGKGHNHWRVRPSGSRYCITCQRERALIQAKDVAAARKVIGLTFSQFVALRGQSWDAFASTGITPASPKPRRKGRAA